jgi:hypothetical protein
MEVEIGNVTSTVRAMDGDALLAPKTMNKIVRAVLEAVKEHEEHGKRAHSERRITDGVSHERDQEER